MLTPPGSGTLGEEIVALKRQIAELLRRKETPPFCRIRLAADATLPVATVFAQQGWTPIEDPYQMFVGGASGVPAKVVIPRTGYYMIWYHSVATGGGANQRHLSSVHLNAATSAAAFISATHEYPLTGTDAGAPCDAFHPRYPLTTGDTLFWSNWSAAAGQLRVVRAGMYTEMLVQYVGTH